MGKYAAWVAAAIIVVVLGVLSYGYAQPQVPAPSEAIVATSTQPAVSTSTPVSKPAPTSAQAYVPQVILGGQTIDVTLAQTPAQQARGLGDRASLGSHEGMLFIFPSDGYESFWMKDMEFSIDMIWLSDDGTVVYIQPNVSPSTYPNSFTPTEPARYVLELPANFAATYGITIGSKAVLP
jgi:uncharacterized membrane protein (UPF0127 family)